MKRNGKYTLNRLHVTSLLLFISIILTFAGCGGGDDQDDDSPSSSATYTISGVAAAGAPIIGTVTIKDSTGTEKVTTIEADGSYSIDVSDLTAPFALRADGYVGGSEYHLYSAALSADLNGTINITPFTDLIIANMAGEIAANYYDNSEFANMTASELEAAEAALQAKLQPILTAIGLEDAIDLLRTSFDTDHTGLDAVIDVVKVTIDPDTVEATLTNILNNETVVVDIADGGTSADTFDSTGVTAGITDLQAMVSVWNTFTALFATSVPAYDNAQLVALFDEDNFLDDGVGLTQWLTEITSDSSMIGISFSNFVLISLDTEAGTAAVSFNIINSDGTTDEGSGVCRMIKQTDGTWRYAGNQRIAHVRIRSEAQYFPYNTDTQIRTGLNITIEANNPAGTEVQSAVVSGPGLPTDGVVLNKQDNYDWFALSGTEENLYSITDENTIDEIIENSEYTISLYDDADGAGNLLDTYTETVLKGPVKLSSLSSASFPTVTAPSVADLEVFSSGSLTVTWTTPTGLSSHWLELVLSNSDQTNSAVYEEDVSETTTTKTLTVDDSLGFTVANRSLFVQARDEYNRRFLIGIW